LSRDNPQNPRGVAHIHDGRTSESGRFHLGAIVEISGAGLK
jgi:hypothetical protein